MTGAIICNISDKKGSGDQAGELLAVELITPKFGGSETVLLQKTAVKITDIVKTA